MGGSRGVYIYIYISIWARELLPRYLRRGFQCVGMSVRNFNLLLRSSSKFISIYTLISKTLINIYGLYVLTYMHKSGV